MHKGKLFHSAPLLSGPHDYPRDLPSGEKIMGGLKESTFSYRRFSLSLDFGGMGMTSADCRG